MVEDASHHRRATLYSHPARASRDPNQRSRVPNLIRVFARTDSESGFKSGRDGLHTNTCTANTKSITNSRSGSDRAVSDDGYRGRPGRQHIEIRRPGRGDARGAAGLRQPHVQAEVSRALCCAGVSPAHDPAPQHATYRDTARDTTGSRSARRTPRTPRGPSRACDRTTTASVLCKARR